MKVIQAVARYYPDVGKIGGIQTHLSLLGKQLAGHGVTSLILASTDDERPTEYMHDGLYVFRYPTAPEPPREPNHGETPHANFEVFTRALKNADADLYHQHQWTPKCGMHHLAAAKKLGLPTLLSIHVPLPICPREDGMYLGLRQCRHFLELTKCQACATFNVLQRKEVIESLVRNRLNAIRFMSEYADRIVLAAQWLFEALAGLGVPESKLVLSTYSVQEPQPAVLKRSPVEKLSCRLAFFGRWTRDKGPHVLVEALRRIPRELPVYLDMYGIPQDTSYELAVRDEASGDSRIRILSAVALSHLPTVLSEYSAVLIPSQWLETGPLMALHARAAGVPVLASRLGGLVEMIEEGVDGLLVTHNDINAWAAAMTRVSQRTDFHPRPPKSTEAEAAELHSLYQSALRGR